MYIGNETLCAAIGAENWSAPGDPYGYAEVWCASSLPEAIRYVARVTEALMDIETGSLNLNEGHVILMPRIADRPADGIRTCPRPRT